MARSRALVAAVFVAYYAALFLMACRTFGQDAAPKTGGLSAAKVPMEVEQPIPFSHKLHIGFDMKCAECHSNPEPGDRMTFPPTDKCMECHRRIAKDKPSIQKLAEFAKAKLPVPWSRVYVLSAWVFWNHRSHLEAGMKCQSCHGEVAKMDGMTAATNVTTMAGCVDCHKKNEASTGCQYCHPGR
jgi:hypothetical protein